MLSEHGVKIAPSTYYEHAVGSRRSGRCATPRSLSLIAAERARQNPFARFGARKMWLHLRCEGHDVARCTVERLYDRARLGRCVAGQACPHHDPRRQRPSVPRIWSTATSPRPPRTSSGSPTSPTSRPGPARSTSRSSSTSLPQDRGLAGRHHHDHRSRARHPRARDLDPPPAGTETWPGWCTTPTPAASTPRSRSPPG